MPTAPTTATRATPARLTITDDYCPDSLDTLRRVTTSDQWDQTGNSALCNYTLTVDYASQREASPSPPGTSPHNHL